MLQHIAARNTEDDSALYASTLSAHVVTRRVWEQKKMQQPPRFPKLDRDLEVDVCIIGAGISGLSTAYELAKEGEFSNCSAMANSPAHIRKHHT